MSFRRLVVVMAGLAGGVALETANAAGPRARPAPEVACPEAPSEFAEVAAVLPDLALRLNDGRTVRPTGLESPRATPVAPTRPDTVRAALQVALVGQTIGIAALGPANRWGSIPAAVFTDEGRLSEDLLARGDVRFRPGPDAHACRPDLLEAEARARQASRGVWADPALRAVDAGADDLATPGIGLAIVEGTVASVGETATRLFLNLGRTRGGFAISLPKRDTSLLGSAIVSRARAIGTRVRVRGLIDRSSSPRIDLSDADALELLPPDRDVDRAPAP